ncbi:MAG: hypothetical protein H6810_05730 [Phycisphaeraceae bacterium]|nr:MAG: hypothetical protein H6810_05730 [Phycisphaeraceae bacterium]
MRISVMCVCAMAAGLPLSGAAGAFTFDDIGFWVGSGDYAAALVIDWNAGPDPVSLAWGYRWSGDATGADMLGAVVAADPNLYARFASFSFGDIVVGLGYDLDGDGFSLSDGTMFDADGIAITAPSDGAVASDPDDHYAEGWDTGFWSYWLGEGEPFGGGTWISSQVGAGDRVLIDGSWDGLRFAPGFVSDTPREPTPAVPAPGAIVGFSMLAISCRGRRSGR